MSENSTRHKITANGFKKKKAKGEKLAVLTAYDYYMAKFLDRAGVDALLIGDSLGMVVYGHDSTLPVTMDTMVHHAAAVASATEYALTIADMPFMSYQPSLEVAIQNAGRFLKETKAQTVKLEGGTEMAETVRRICDIGIPVMGHIGMTPQSINRFGRPKVQGKTKESKKYLIDSAIALEEAGAYGMVLELIEQNTAKEISEKVSIPTIGIGSGPHCDGQVLVINDILGMYDEFQAKFVRRYAELPEIIEKAAKAFVDDVKSGNYPSADESF